MAASVRGAADLLAGCVVAGGARAARRGRRLRRRGGERLRAGVCHCLCARAINAGECMKEVGTCVYRMEAGHGTIVEVSGGPVGRGRFEVTTAVRAAPVRAQYMRRALEYEGYHHSMGYVPIICLFVDFIRKKWNWPRRFVNLCSQPCTSFKPSH